MENKKLLEIEHLKQPDAGVYRSVRHPLQRLLAAAEGGVFKGTGR